MIDQNTIDIRLNRDGKSFALLQFLYCTTKFGDMLRMEIGATSDGMSGGKLVDMTFEDEHTFLPAVFHDGCYRDRIEKFVDGEWVRYTMGKDEADTTFRDNMEDAGASEFEAHVIYMAVAEWGRSSFEEDREGRLSR